MVLFFTSTLAVSIVGLVTLLLLKRWEMDTGRVVFSSVRPVLGEFLHRLVYFVERRLPTLLWALARRVWAMVRRATHALVAWAVLVLERVLESSLVGLRRKTSLPKGSRERSSEFLREVAEHKKKLQELEDRAIYED